MYCLTALTALVAVASASPLLNAGFEKSSVWEKKQSPPKGWAKSESAALDKDALGMKLRIHLVQNHTDFHDLALKIATPGDELYGKHLPQHVINTMVAPRDESLDLVMKWLDSEDMGSKAAVSQRGDAVIIEASVSQIEKLLKAEYSAYVKSTTNEGVVRTLEYSLPDALKGHVDDLQPTTYFGLQAMKSAIKEVRLKTNTTIEATNGVQAVTGCSGSDINPTCLSHLYSFSDASGTQTSGKIGIAGFLEQWPSKSDLKSFMSDLAVFDNTAETYTCIKINDGTCPSSPGENVGTEANLDVQYVRAITAEIKNEFYSVGGSPPYDGTGSNTNEPYLEFLDYLLGLSDSELPNTVSISYGDDESTVPLAYADNVCNLFSQLGARGVSILVASGDDGVGSGCTDSFLTSFPAACPWVTTVGGTTGHSPEGAWTDSGGGFSSIFGTPSYQQDTVDTWLTGDSTHKSVDSYFNSSGRGYPDVSAQSTDFEIVIDGEEYLVDGTSCATPTFASVIQLINSNRLEAGKTGLGFLNPWLYANATDALTDITKGSNTGCSELTGKGFDAVSGWDPATGLGTPDYTKLLKLSDAI